MTIIDYFYKNNKNNDDNDSKNDNDVESCNDDDNHVDNEDDDNDKNKEIKLIIVNYHPPIAEVRGLTL